MQEGLTNALKHARASRADVDVHYDDAELRLTVRDNGTGVAGRGAANGGLGHGLVGISERVKIYGGTMTAQATPGTGFELSARLPLDGGGS